MKTIEKKIIKLENQLKDMPVHQEPPQDVFEDFTEEQVQALEALVLAYRFSFPPDCNCATGVSDTFSPGIDFGPPIGVRKCGSCFNWFAPENWRRDLKGRAAFWINQLQSVLRDIEDTPARVEEMRAMDSEEMTFLISLVDYQKESLKENQGP